MNRFAIHSVPRSGSSWLGAILDSCPNTIYKFQPLFSYAEKGALSTDSTLQEINEFFQRIEANQDDFMNQVESKDKNEYPRFNKTSPTTVFYKEVRYHYILDNLLEKDKKIKVIGLIRNPLATLNSWLKAPKEFKKEQGWKEEEEWRMAPQKNQNRDEEFNGYEKWKEVAFLFKYLELKYPKRFYFLKYDHLIHNTLDTTQKLFNFLDLSLTDQTIRFISKTPMYNSTGAYSVFNNKLSDNKWKTQLHSAIKEEILADISKNNLELFL